MAKRTFILSESFVILVCMKNIIFIALFSLFLVGCSSTPKVSKTPVEKITNKQQKPSEPVTAHTTDKEKDAEVAKTAEVKDVPKSKGLEGKKNWSQGGNAIDVTDLNKDIESAEKKSKADPNDEILKKNLSQAYTKRGLALTTARQYAAAVGDYRKALKANPNNEIAKTWVEQIENIYKTLPGKEMPKEGEEPKPLEFKK